MKVLSMMKILGILVGMLVNVCFSMEFDFPRNSNAPVPSFVFNQCGSCNAQGELIQPFVCEHSFCIKCTIEKAHNGCSVCKEIARECPVCMEVPSQESLTTLCCMHSFCKGCIANRDTCPVCDRKVEHKTQTSCESCDDKFENEEELVCLTCEMQGRAIVHRFHDKCLMPHIGRTAYHENAHSLKFPCPVHHEIRHPLPAIDGVLPIEGIQQRVNKPQNYTTAAQRGIGYNCKCSICDVAFEPNASVSELKCEYKGKRETHYFHSECHDKHMIKTARCYSSEVLYPCPVHPQSWNFVPKE